MRTLAEASEITGVSEYEGGLRLHFSPIPNWYMKCGCPCPVCDNKMLRGWSVGERTIALCHDCGSLFWCDTGLVEHTFTGDKNFFAGQALIIVGELISKSKRR